MMEQNFQVEIYDLLYRLGLTANYTGFFHIAYATRLAVHRPDRLRLITKWLYPDVAKHCQTTAGAVERDIRYAVERIWTENPSRLIQISYAPLSRKPSNAKFLSILAVYLSHGPPD